MGEKDILILVDGVERPIDRLTVEEVESVTVLKDAAAVARCMEQFSRTVLVWHQLRQLMGCLPHAVPHRRLRSGDGLQGQHRYRPAHC